MPGKSSSPVEWWSLLEPATESVFFRRGDPDDPRLGETVTRCAGGKSTIEPGQPVIIGFPCDEGVRRNGGRVGAAQAPNAIREQLYRQTTWDGRADLDLSELALLDLGNVRIEADLETCQERLGRVVAGLLQEGAVPIVIGGGHEAAYGHFLGYAGSNVGIINIDAHLDVRPYSAGGHSGSPFRQAMEHPQHPLKRGGYVVIGAQRQSVAKSHLNFVERHGGRIQWLEDLPLLRMVGEALDRLAGNAIMVSVDADAFQQADVPGTSSPSPIGFFGAAWPLLAQHVGKDANVRSIEIVEVNPLYDRDNQTARWAALGVRHFMCGLALRREKS